MFCTIYETKDRTLWSDKDYLSWYEKSNRYWDELHKYFYSYVYETHWDDHVDAIDLKPIILSEYRDQLTQVLIDLNFYRIDEDDEDPEDITNALDGFVHKMNCYHEVEDDYAYGYKVIGLFDKYIGSVM